MLVITRKNGESVRIGEEIEIVVTQIGRGKIRIGISAPPEVPILRSELAGQSCRGVGNRTCRGTRQC
jgi:carbon storage regulator